MRGDKTEINPT